MLRMEEQGYQAEASRPWLPVIEGCDWDSAEIAVECHTGNC